MSQGWMGTLLGGLQPLRVHTRLVQGLKLKDALVPCSAAVSPFLLDTEDAWVPHSARPLLSSHCIGPTSCPTGGLSHSSIPPGPSPHLHGKRAAVTEGSPRDGGAHNSGSTRDVQRGKALQQAPNGALFTSETSLPLP